MLLLITSGVQLPDGVMISRSTGEELTLVELIEELAEFDVVFAGEQHDAEGAHAAELAILQGLAEKDSSLVLAMEMFERDVEEVLYAYWVGDIEEDSFLAASRPWGNYQTDYRPLVEFARLRRIPIVAANVPRRTAAAVARAGEATPEVLGEDSIYIPDTLHLDSEKYYGRFTETMQTMPHGSPMGGMNVDAFYKAQVLKDAVMAQALHPYLDRQILFVCGRFHSDYHLGVPYQLSRNNPGLEIAVIALMPAGEEIDTDEADPIADYLWIYPEPQTDTD